LAAKVCGLGAAGGDNAAREAISMDQHTYEQFTKTLHARLAADERVLGLVALGSMADPLRRDQWSDQDFWVITQPDAQEHCLADLSWLPNASNIILPFRQGSQYYMVLYRNGHSAEFAVFDREQMQQGKTDRYSVLFDKANTVFHKQVHLLRLDCSSSLINISHRV
jgi:hypothetical protein